MVADADDWRRIEQLAEQIKELAIQGQQRSLTLKQRQFVQSLTQSIAVGIPGIADHSDDIAPLLMELSRVWTFSHQ